MSKILVSGGAGFIGSHLVDKLIKDKHKVVVIDNLSGGKKEHINKNAKFYKVDICSSKISDIFKKEKFDYVFHLAAIPRVPYSVKEPVKTTKVNVLGTANVFKTAYDNGVKRIVFASSSSVYGDQKKLPLVETMPSLPVSPYGMQKLQGEELARLFSNLYELPVVCLRYFNVYGPRIDFNSDYSLVLGKFLRFSKENKPLTIYGDGKQTRAFCYVDDVVEANIKAMKSKKIKGGEVINIGGKQSHSVNYLASLISNDIKYLPVRKGDVLHTMADTKKAKRLLDWSSKTEFEKGIEKTKKWFKTL